MFLPTSVLWFSNIHMDYLKRRGFQMSVTRKEGEKDQITHSRKISKLQWEPYIR
jgi:hypothetical protein